MRIQLKTKHAYENSTRHAKFILALNLEHGFIVLNENS
jgi:hypothetical protein